MGDQYARTRGAEMPAPADRSVHHRGKGRPKRAKDAATGVEAADRVERIEGRANPSNPSGPTIRFLRKS